MKKKTIFIVIAIFALLSQIAFPSWWFLVGGSFFIFWMEGIIEGGFFKDSVIFQTAFFSGIFSIYSVIALIVPILSFFSIKGMDSEQIYTKKKNIVFLTINILTIIISVTFLIWAIFLSSGFP